jgi:uncharacterized protein (DUF885 family)
MSHLLLSLLLVPALVQAQSAAAPSSQAQLDASRRLAQLSEDYWATEMRLSPLSATLNNYGKYDDRLEDNSALGRAEERRENLRLLAALERIDRSALGDSGQVTYDIMKVQLEDALEAEKHKFWEWNVDHIDGFQTNIPTVVSMAQPMKTADDAQALALRLEGYPAYVANQIANLREGMKDGRVAAKVPVERLISQLDDMLKKKPEETAFADAVKRLPDSVGRLYSAAIYRAIETHVQPALADYARFLKDEYVKNARPDKIGLSDLPGGKEAYAYTIRHHTTVVKTPEELHQIGLDELKGIHEELMKIAKRRKFKGDLHAFTESVKKDPANFFKTRDEIVEDARARIARAQAKVPEYFSVIPKTPLVVKAYEDYKEQNAPGAEYYEPSDDLTRPGVYYINTYEPETRPRYGMTSLAAHEGIPGHHFQIARAVEMRDLPAFRRHAGFNAFIEGWALYTERLADEMGLYQDDLSRVGMLSDQSLRAARLVVDTGIHAMGWSRQKAIDFMVANTVDSEKELIDEVDRYTIWPGQALSYKVGQREILELRKQSQKKLGKAFDIKKFHEDVLKNGSVPLSVLREVVLK